ncbi:MAG: DUF3179 domain-containing protein [Candidatus Lambdaproteobacteria bacterium]|nr:DUF3179 domain-containing protein [Candidatus Lambdaproteobacteria bacterium]
MGGSNQRNADAARHRQGAARRGLVVGAALHVGLLAMLCAWPVAAAERIPGDQHLSPQVQVWRGEWTRTDFAKASVDFREIISGGPPRDGIPPIDKPAFVSNAEAAVWLEAGEPVLVVERGADVRAYPLQVLIWHEIVNDTVGGDPLVITFCPLCNSALVFDRRVEGRVLDFGTTGKLRNSDLVMWDRQTESWWQQLTGTGIVGAYTGTTLTFLPAPLVAFATYRQAFPQGKVLSRETGHFRPYGINPYEDYDSPENTQPFLMRSAVDARLPATERVVALERGSVARAYPYRLLAPLGAVNDRLGGEAVVVFFTAGTRSALAGRVIGESREVGSGAVFARKLEGRELTFVRSEAGRWLDEQTHSTWNQFGHATAGPLLGKRLTPLPHGNHFAFAWLAFRPDSSIWSAP